MDYSRKSEDKAQRKVIFLKGALWLGKPFFDDSWINFTGGGEPKEGDVQAGRWNSIQDRDSSWNSRYCPTVDSDESLSLAIWSDAF